MIGVASSSPRAPSLAQINGQVALGLEVLAALLRVLEEQSQLLPPEAVGRLKQLQAQARLRCQPIATSSLIVSH